MTRKRNIVNAQWNYDVGNENIYNTDVLKSNLCDINDAYFLVRGDIVNTAYNPNPIAFKNYVVFIKWITKSDVTTIDDAENLNLVMPIYNLMEYSLNYSQTTRIFGFIHKMKPVILMLLLLIIITVVTQWDYKGKLFKIYILGSWKISVIFERQILRRNDVRIFELAKSNRVERI